MEKEFVNYNQALKLKALGFNEPCFATWSGETLDMSLQIPSDDYFTKAPTYSQAFRWFREKYGLFIQPNRTIDSEGIWYYFSIASKRTDVCEGSFVYEEAEIACLEKLIEIVESKSE